MSPCRGRSLFVVGTAASLVAGLTLASSAVATTGPTAPNPFVGDPAWVAYQTDREGHEAVWLVHPDGTDDHPIDTGLSVDTLLPDWSPDGAQIVMASRGGDTEPLYEYDIDNAQITQLFDCSEPCVGDDEPAYSPDGISVAFIRALGPFVDEVPSDCGLWVGDRATGEVRQLTSNAGCAREYLPRWSPDGTQLTYHRELPQSDGQLTTAVYVINADGTGERQLTDPDMVAGAPDWSPDGEWIVFSTYPLNVFQTEGDSRLVRIHPDGTGLEELTATGGVRETQPRYRPDGEWIVFTVVRPDQRSLWAIPATGGDPVVIADRDVIYTHGTWQ